MVGGGEVAPRPYATTGMRGRGGQGINLTSQVIHQGKKIIMRYSVKRALFSPASGDKHFHLTKYTCYVIHS